MKTNCLLAGLLLLLTSAGCHRAEQLQDLQGKAVKVRFFLNDVDYYCLSHRLTGDGLVELCEGDLICYEGPEGWLQFSGNPFHPGCMHIRSPWFILPDSFASTCTTVSVTYREEENYFDYYLCFGELNCSEGFPMEFTLWWPGTLQPC